MVDVIDCITTEKSIKGADMELVHPGTNRPLTHAYRKQKEPKKMYLTLLGPESVKVRRVLQQIQSSADQPVDQEELTEEVIEQDRVRDSQMLASITVGGEVFWNGKWTTITEENAYELYYQVTPFRMQASRFALNLGNYTSS